MEEQPKTFEQARAEEEMNSLLAHLPYAQPVLGVPLVPLRWSHELELLLAQNALFIGTAPLRGDFQEMLWRLHPYFCRGDGRFPNLPIGVKPPSWLTVFGVKVMLWLICRKLQVHSAEPIVRDWLRAQRQDAPGNSKDEAQSAASRLTEKVNQFDNITLHFSQMCGYRPGEILELGVAWTWQQLRAAALTSGNDAAASRFIRPSASLVKFEPEAAPDPKITPFPAQEAVAQR